MLDHSFSHPYTTKNLSPTKSFIRVLCYRCSQLFFIIVFQVAILNFIYLSQSKSHSLQQQKQANHCKYGSVYVYDLPPMFNKHLLDRCHHLDPWISRCNAISNAGLGPKSTGLSPVPENLIPAWYWTDMYAGEVIYHSRILKHKCRTMEPESATAFYIPFYAGLAVGRYIIGTNYTKQRDMHSERLLRWVHDQQPWRRSNGSDHFIMLGRTTWDFRRLRDEGWGSSFLNMPLMERVVRLGIEEATWDHMEVSVPYPTGFHPRSKQEINQWLDFVGSRDRTSLYTFVGGTRKVKEDFRTVLLSHCYNESSTCRVVDCSVLPCQDGSWKILEAFLASDFCLQPRGETYTRKSMFDCMLAGSIPVFFWRESIWGQYEWFLGDEPEKFSVFIDRNGLRNGTTSIRKVLEGYSRDEVRRMREKVISLIPKFVYSDGDGIGEDAFDIVVDGVLKRFQEENVKENNP